ncbi:Mss4-like protein [Lasiosphaeria miniovina]|uniref:Mss4-like protein n=1 Tax=Lasiosphaeria miniovina TaxID=1954250 RepID=A0AA40E7B2_9PEZI|nr:Mss4-like protein [Lasiosphaeria miniovina]KAK0727717.1 Mss4-like protein [Lasiosphaeria miniovina]
MALHLQGRCVCKHIQYSLDLESPDQARTTLCHCKSCHHAFRANHGLTAKVPQYNGVTREFCDNCGDYICEYGEEAADKFRYVVWGTLDDPDEIPPKGEFFCRYRDEWMPEIPDEYLDTNYVFHKQEIKE